MPAVVPPVLGPGPLPIGPVLMTFGATTGGTVQIDQIVASALPDFPQASSSTYYWNVSFDGAFAPPVAIVFQYDNAALEPGVDEARLEIYQLQPDGTWEGIDAVVDTDANTITVEAGKLGVFALGIEAAEIPSLGIGATLILAVIIGLTAVTSRAIRFSR